jgi:glucose/arabinose dehydrogenase
MPIAVFLAAAAASACSAALAHQHEKAPPPTRQIQAAPAKRFAADATLRKEMQGVRTAVDALGHYEHGHMGPEQAVLLATNIEGHVNAIVAGCKLPPDADAALHPIISPLMQGARALKKNPQDALAIARMREALANFDRQFKAAEPE